MHAEPRAVSRPQTASDESRPAEPPADGYIRIEAKGHLKTGIVAIGGETTGTQLATDELTLELDFGRHTEVRNRAEQLDGKTVVVTGRLTAVEGVERGRRLVVRVRTLRAAATGDDDAGLSACLT
ncbi:MAG: hypothetical protein KY476_21095, partial [Planctomycetes bacterium]|nr:hypothetical protein [Planctomycetota bacterium]